MKILFLNLWHGKRADALRLFLAQHEGIDAFCFQEVETDFVWPDFFSHYARFDYVKTVVESTRYSLSTFVHSRHVTTLAGKLFAGDEETGIGLAVKIVPEGGAPFTLVNIHGIARACEQGYFVATDEKRDFPARLRQSETLLRFMQSAGLVIAGGDFNVSPDTESFHLLHRAGYRELISEYRIPTTRNHFTWDRYPNILYLFSDYVFVSSGIPVRTFSVPDVRVSDHLPMILEIE